MIKIFKIFNWRQGKRTPGENHLKALISVALADGEVQDSEYQFLLGVAFKFNMTEVEVDRLISEYVQGDVDPPKSKFSRFKQMYNLVGMMVANGSIKREEMTICKKMAQRLGYDHEIIDELIYSITQNVSMGHTEEETLKRVSFLVGVNKHF